MLARHSIVLPLALLCYLPTTLVALQDHPDRPQPSTVYIPFEWKVGDKHTYRITKTTARQKPADGPGQPSASKPVVIRQSVSELKLLVESKQEDGLLVIKWTPKLPPAADEEISRDPIYQRLVKIYSDLEIKVGVDQDGVFQGILNWPEVDAKVKRSFAIVNKIVDDLALPEQKKRAVMTLAMKQFETRQAIELQLTQPMQLLAAMTNCEFSQTDDEVYETEAPYLGVNLPSTETYSIGKVAGTEWVQVNWIRIVDMNKSLPLVEQAMTQLAKDLKEDIPQPGFMKGFSLISKATYEIDLNTGWARRVSFENTAGQPGSLTTKSILLERL